MTALSNLLVITKSDMRLLVSREGSEDVNYPLPSRLISLSGLPSHNMDILRRMTFRGSLGPETINMNTNNVSTSTTKALGV